MSHKSLTVWCAAIFLSLFLCGCSRSSLKHEQPIIDNSIQLNQSTNIGQSFTAHFDGLTGITISISSVAPGDSEIVFHLRSSPYDLDDLRTVFLDPNSFSNSPKTIIEFPPVPASSQDSFFFLLEYRGEGYATICTANTADYLFGALYQNGKAQDSQIAFDLVYQNSLLYLGILSEIIKWLGWILIGVFLFIIPGWALLRAVWSDWTRYSVWLRLGLSGSVSMAAYPVLFLFADIINIPLGNIHALLPGALGTCYLAWANRSILKKHPFVSLSRSKGPTPRILWLRSFWPNYLLALVILLVFISRFWSIRTIVVPMWGDSVQHTVMSQLIMDHNGLFSSWEPYAPYRSLTVHFGFSVLTALFAWLVDIPSHTAALITAQWINAFAVVALIPLAMQISKKSIYAAIVTCLAAGLLSPMPAFYVNWGRFAQLGGQAILPATIWMSWNILDQTVERLKGNPDSKSHWSRLWNLFRAKALWLSILVAGLTLTGMTLTYYRMIFYFATFFLAFVLGKLLNSSFRSFNEWAAFGISAGAIGVTSLVVFLPWLLRVKNSALSSMVATGMSTGIEISNILNELQEWGNLDAYLPVWLAILSFIALIWTIIQRKWEVAAFGFWIGFLQLYHMGGVIQLPGANMLQVFAILIWIYFPTALLIGWLFGEIIGWLESHNIRFVHIGLNVILLILALFGANKIRLTTQPSTYNMVTQPDLRAMEWIRTNTPENSIFLVEMWRAHNGRSAVGTDAGWWLPLLSGRKNSMPPQYALLSEVPEPANYSKRVVELTAALEDEPITDPRNLKRLCRNGITYVFIGQRGGSVGAGTLPLFKAYDLLNHPEFHLDYHEDMVYIFSLDPAVCSK